MAFLNELKEKISAFVFRALNALRKGWDILKNSGEKHSVEGEIRRRYEELGRTIYESKGENMSACREICDKIDVLAERLETLTQNDVMLRSRVRCPRCGKVMAKQARFCSACGEAMPEDQAAEMIKEQPED